MRFDSILWDLDDDPDGNVQHCADHGVTKEEVEEVFENAFPGFVVYYHIKRAGAFRSGVFGMATRIQVKTCPVLKEDVEEPLGGDQLFEHGRHDLSGSFRDHDDRQSRCGIRFDRRDDVSRSGGGARPS